MKFENTASPTVGNVTEVTTSDAHAKLNVDEYGSAASKTTFSRTGFPKQGGQSLSHWQQQVRCDPLLDHRTTENLPTDADVVVIGSGMTGTLVTKTLLETSPDRSIVVLEARDFCSGATSRNAGHCKPDQWRHFAKFEKAFGAEQALKIQRNEQKTWEALVSYVKENNVDCDLWVGETLDVPLDEEVAKVSEDAFEKWKAAGGTSETMRMIRDPEQAAKMSRIKSAKACYAWSASTLQPWKLTAHIMRGNLSKGANLQTSTQVDRVTETTENGRKWRVLTQRGDITCDTVVHATNAYSAAVEPSLEGIITPKPHMCNRVIPPRHWSGSKAIQNSYGVLLPNGGLFSINPRCTADGAIMFGGSNPGQKALDEWAEKNPGERTNDGLSCLESVTKHVRDFANRELEGWTDAPLGPGEGFDYSWSGIIGLSADGVPFVGELPGKPGQWVCAGHHGHGMARIFTAAPGLAKLINRESWSATELPEAYELTKTRLEKLQEAQRLGAMANIAVI